VRRRPSRTASVAATAAPRPWEAVDPAALRLGVSSCLLGQSVRYDGGHKRDSLLTDLLGPYVEWVPVCPEVELGLGIPREPIRLVRRGDEVRLVAERSGTDHTAAMRRLARRRVAELRSLDLSGYVFKKNSPSCGVERVRVHPEKPGPPRREGRGLFAAVLMEALPLLPVEEEERLRDPGLRESFVERLFAYRRLQGLLRSRPSGARLAAFHTAHKLQLLAHAPAASRELGRLVAEAGRRPPAALLRRYAAAFMRALARPASRRRHVNVLEHALGHLRGRLDPDSRAELRELIHRYGEGELPLVVPLTLLGHHVRHLGVETLAGQVYLEPHPRELALRNRV